MFVRINTELKPLVHGVWYWNENTDYRGRVFEVKPRKVRKYMNGKRVSLVRYDVVHDSVYNTTTYPDLPTDRFISSLDCDEFTLRIEKVLSAAEDKSELVKDIYKTQIRPRLGCSLKKADDTIPAKEYAVFSATAAKDYIVGDDEACKEILSSSKDLNETPYSWQFHPADKNAHASSGDIKKILEEEKLEDEKAVFTVKEKRTLLDILGFTYYQHYKTGGFYKKVGIGRDCNKCDVEIVCYKALQKTDFPKGQLWLRAYDNFYYPGRFRKLTFKEVLLLWIGMEDAIDNRQI